MRVILRVALAVAVVGASFASIAFMRPPAHAARQIDHVARHHVALRHSVALRHGVALRRPADAPGEIPIVPAEWQWSASHSDEVPEWIRQEAAGVTIAVIDTGADVHSAAFAQKDLLTYSVGSRSPDVQDTVGHGTFVASIAAGESSPEIGLEGFGGLAKLMIVKASREGSSFTDRDESAAIIWAVNQGARIVNLSFAGSGTSTTERNAVRYATSHGVLLVAAAGNDGRNGNPKTYPAALIGEEGLVVGASEPGGSRAAFSTTGRYVDVLAPGVNVLGAVASGHLSDSFAPLSTPAAPGAVGLGTGTSFATPEVAGAAALVWAANPLLDAAGVAAVIEATSSGNGAWSTDHAFGTINVGAAVAQALSGAVPRTPLRVRQPSGPAR